MTTGNFLQSPLWADVNRRLGRDVVVLPIKTPTETPANININIDTNANANDNINDTAAPAIYATVRDARRGRYLEIPAGPLINWADPASVSDLFTTLAQEAKSRHCVFIRFRPDLLDTKENYALISSALSGFDLRPAKMHLAAQNTVILDLTLSEDDLLMSFRRQTRYEVRRAEKQKIFVTEDNSKSAIASFHQLQKATAARQDFIPPSLPELEAERAAFGPYFHLFSSYLPLENTAQEPNPNTSSKTTSETPNSNQEPTLLCSGLFLSDTNKTEAAYFEAASTELSRKHPGAYALIWYAIRFFKSANYKKLNLWGIAPPGVENHRYSGVTTFKTGFGGEIVNFLPAQDIILDKFRYKLTDLIETSRKKKRKL